MQIIRAPNADYPVVMTDANQSRCEQALAVARQALEEISDPQRAWPVRMGGPAQAIAARAGEALAKIRSIETSRNQSETQ